MQFAGKRFLIVGLSQIPSPAIDNFFCLFVISLAARLDIRELSVNSCCTEVGRRTNRPVSQTTPGHHDFGLGGALAPRPCFSGGSRIFCDVKPDNGARHMMDFTRFSLGGESRKNRDREYPALPHRSFLRRKQRLVQARVPAFGRVEQRDENLRPAGKRFVNFRGIH
jgi:hypothetical protein